jgi:HD-GYP domain-containing protein (c-di-GMP phosphodiesterase class II)
LFSSIRFKLSFIFLLVVALFTAASLAVVTNTLARSTHKELIRKGFSICALVARVAGEKPLPGKTRLWREIGEKLAEHGGEALFIAAVDGRGLIRAHTRGSIVGTPFEKVEGKVLDILEDGSTAREVIRASVPNYEFRMPVRYDGKKIGDIYLALDAYSIVEAKRQAWIKIFIFSAAALALGLPGIFYLSSRFTTPIKKLSEGFVMLPEAGQMEEIRVPSSDEMGELTHRFNEMSRTILEQKRELRQTTRELEEAYVATVRLLATVIDAKDQYTRGHSSRVARLSVLLGRRLGLGREALKDLEISSMFHDVGKIRTPDSILNKAEPLNPDEYGEIMRHTRDGAEILGVVNSLHKHIPAALYHHERFDGSGYPEGLKAEQIPPAASIISIADAYDAMITARPYRAAMSKKEAIEEIIKCKGTQFDPRIIEHFVGLLNSREADIPLTGTWYKGGH